MITCSLVLCSVAEQASALSNIKHLLRPDGGTCGYIEHVAVNPSEKGHFLLEWEQQLLDPLQQAVAHNCHLHRFTEDAINHEFAIVQPVVQQEASLLWNERFFVEDMWPVSCQCCGVIQRIA